MNRIKIMKNKFFNYLLKCLNDYLIAHGERMSDKLTKKDLSFFGYFNKAAKANGLPLKISIVRDDVYGNRLYSESVSVNSANENLYASLI